jgi:hypothetical protein
MLVAQYCETDCRYAFCDLSAFLNGRIEVIIPFEMPPVLLKKLSGLLQHSRLGLAEHWTVASTSRPTASQTLSKQLFIHRW